MVNKVEFKSALVIAGVFEALGLVVVFIACATSVTSFVISVMLALAISLIILLALTRTLVEKIDIQWRYGNDSLRSACMDVFPQAAVDARLHELWLKLDQAAKGEIKLEGILEGGATLVALKSREIETARTNLERAIQSAHNAGYRVHARTDLYAHEPTYFT